MTSSSFLLMPSVLRASKLLRRCCCCCCRCYCCRRRRRSRSFLGATQAGNERGRVATSISFSQSQYAATDTNIERLWRVSGSCLAWMNSLEKKQNTHSATHPIFHSSQIHLPTYPPMYLAGIRQLACLSGSNRLVRVATDKAEVVYCKQRPANGADSSS